MNWVWRRLAPFVKANIAVEITGISEERLQNMLHQEALRRLQWIETVVFNEEISDEEKVQMVQSEFLKD